MKHRTLFRRTTALLLALLLSLSLTLPAFAEDETPDISITPETATLTVDETTQLSYQLDNVADADKANITISWKSLTPSIATVDNTGLVTAKSEGPVTITVTATLPDGSEISDACTVTVKAATTLPSQLFLDQTRISLTVNDYQILYLTTSPLTADTSTVVWSSSNATVATVTQNGRVDALKAGTTDITVSLPGTDISATCTVTVRDSPVVLDTVILYLSQKEDMTNNTTVKAFANGQTVTWKSADTDVATVTQGGVVTAVSAGETTVTATNVSSGQSAYCTVIVSGMALYDYETDERLCSEGLSNKDDPVQIQLGDTLILTYKTYGAAVDNAPAASASWYSSNNNVATVSGGNVYTRGTGKSVISVELGDYRVECYIQVEENTDKNIVGTINADGTLDFSDTVSGGKTRDLTKSIAVQMNERCLSQTGDSLNYITSLSVDPEQGTLYYNYVSPENHGTGVGAMDTYYYDSNSTQKDIEDLTFVPKSDFSGTATIAYTGYSEDGTLFNGEIRLTINPVSGISYTTAVGTPVTFLADDFSDYCESQTGRALDYVTFALPAASRGTLYYNYANGSKYAEPVESGASYYRSRSPKLSDVTFVPASGYSGSFDISYRGVDTAGTSYNGTVTINVTGGVTSGDVYYSGTRGAAIQFSAADFNTACKAATGEALNYVEFTLPDSGQGSLYVNYSATSRSVTKVAAGDKYYRSGTTPYISSVSFVAATGSDDIIILPFTATGESGGTYAGQVHITLDGASEDEDPITYYCEIGSSVYFNADDFNKLFQSVYGVGMKYIQFEAVPTSAQGKLYYKGSSNAISVPKKEYYYYTSSSSTNRLLSNVYFTAYPGYQGTVKIPFTGQSTAGDEYEGSMTIRVSDSVATTLAFSGTSMPISLDLEKLRQTCNSKTGNSLSYISFTSLPSQDSGRLYADYSGLNTGTEVTIGTKYYDGRSPSASRLVFLPKAGFQGSTTFTYTGADTRGETYTGTITITVYTASMTSHFTDMSGYSSAIPAVEFLYQNGIVNGVTDEKYGPSQPITRAAFVTMLVRAFQFESTETTSFPDVPSGSYYAQSVATAKALGIVEGSNGKFLPNNYLTRQEAMAMLYRALQVKGWTLTASQSTLSAFTDGNQVSSYARDAVSAMVQLGVVQGYPSGALGPRDSITRAAMAVILHRILTL